MYNKTNSKKKKTSRIINIKKKSIDKKLKIDKINNKSFSSIFGNELYKGNDLLNTDLELKNKIVLLYYSADWCPPCRKLTPLLIEFYNKFHKSKGFEIVLISKDRTYYDYMNYYNKMPWLSLPFGKELLTNLNYNYSFIPQIVILDKNQNLINSVAQNDFYNDLEGNNFPWFSNK